MSRRERPVVLLFDEELKSLTAYGFGEVGSGPCNKVLDDCVVDYNRHYESYTGHKTNGSGLFEAAEKYGQENPEDSFITQMSDEFHNGSENIVSYIFLKEEQKLTVPGHV